MRLIGEALPGDRVRFRYRGKPIAGHVARVKRDDTRIVAVTGDDAFHAIGDEAGLVDVGPAVEWLDVEETTP